METQFGLLEKVFVNIIILFGLVHKCATLSFNFYTNVLLLMAIEKNRVFYESVYDGKKEPYIISNGNINLFFIKKDRQINQLRRDLHFEENYWSMSVKEKISEYTRSKKLVVELNKKVREYFFNKSCTNLECFLQAFNCIKFNKNVIDLI
jgi:hypothetical protein